MRKTFINKDGFTLVEIVVTLALVGILASVAGMGIAWGLRGYSTMRENIVISQKAQLALGRIHKELTVISDIILNTSAGSSSATCIIYKADTRSDDYRIIRYDSAAEELVYLSSAACTACDCSAVAGSTLADDLGSAAFTYYNTAGDSIDLSPVSQAYTAADVGAVKVTLAFKRTDGGADHEFKVTVSPRNNGNLNAPGVAS